MLTAENREHIAEKALEALVKRNIEAGNPQAPDELRADAYGIADAMIERSGR